MNINPETDLDLEKLFLPAWAQESSNRYAHFTGEESNEPGERRRGDRRGPRREGERRDGGGARGENRPRGPRRDNRQGGERGPRRDERGSERRDDRRAGGGGFRAERREPREVAPLPQIECALLPDENGVESLTRQIRVTGRAYPLFDIARLILQKPERYGVKLSVKKNAEGQILQPLFVCALDDTVWLSEDEAVSHVLSRHFQTFYQPERTATEPPKGVYTFVAQCGMSGEILGPPNYHDYQNKLRKLHAERFARMPFDVFKSRVKIVRDEAVVKQWVEELSWRTEYACLNVPEPLKLPNREEVANHFRATHKDSIIKPAEEHKITGLAARGIRSPELSRLVRTVVEDQRRFPLQVATGLSQQFAQRGLQFFKKDKSITHVSVARPNYLDLETTPVSDGVRRIVEFVNATPKCSRRQLVEALAPSPAPAPIPVAAEGEAAPAQPQPPAPTPEQTAVISDLHWLIHQGHVLEFANGTMETAKKPAPRPPKPEAKPKAAEAPTVAEALPVEETPASQSADAVPAESIAVETPPTEPAPEITATSSETPASGDAPVSDSQVSSPS